jgi:hypothetical protein
MGQLLGGEPKQWMGGLVAGVVPEVRDCWQLSTL